MISISKIAALTPPFYVRTIARVTTSGFQQVMVDGNITDNGTDVAVTAKSFNQASEVKYISGQFAVVSDIVSLSADQITHKIVVDDKVHGLVVVSKHVGLDAEVNELFADVDVSDIDMQASVKDYNL